MPNAEHVALALRGAEAVNEWRKTNPDVVLDLSNASLCEPPVQLDGARLSPVKLVGAVIDRGSFKDANLRDANMLGCHGHRADFSEATLSGAILDRADLEGANLVLAQIDGASFKRTNLSHARLGYTIGGDRAISLHLATYSSPHEHRDLYQAMESWTISFINRWSSWSAIRKFGQLPILGLSWSLLITLPLLVNLIGFYNARVESAHAWAERVQHAGQAAGGILEPPAVALATVIQERLQPLGIHWKLSLGYFGVLLLAAASLMYSIGCPDRVQEFTESRWVDELGQPVIHYRPLTWTGPGLRIACMGLYLVGGVCSIVVLLWTTGETLLQLVRLL